jgi:hypothetical protein
MPASNFKCSLERKDNMLGYEITNTQFIAAEFNTTRQWTAEKIEHWRQNRQSTPAQLAAQDERVHSLLRPAAIPKCRRMMDVWRDVIDGVSYIGCNYCEKIKRSDEFSPKRPQCRECETSAQRRTAETLQGCMAKLFQTARGNCKKYGRPEPTITIADLVNLFVAQKGLCHWSKLPDAG